MGKFQSKFVPRRRQSPEGGSLASNVLNCQRELEHFHIHKTKLTKNVCIKLKEKKSDRSGSIRALLPPKRTTDRGNGIHFLVSKWTKKRSGHAGVPECGVARDEDAQQEWVFTLYEFDSSGKVAKDDMCNLIHSMYEVLEASVKRPYVGATPMKIKLVLSPSADPQSAGKEQSASQESGGLKRRLYCVDENIERRNHYLDLAGIENYTSKFDNTESLPQESRRDAHFTRRHHRVMIRENSIFPESPRGLAVPPVGSKPMAAGKDRDRGGRSCRFRGQQPASWCHPSYSVPAAQRIHKRPRSRAHKAALRVRPVSGGDREISYFQASCGALASPAQRHEHHHQHDHHHHHHHHYYSS